MKEKKKKEYLCCIIGDFSKDELATRYLKIFPIILNRIPQVLFPVFFKILYYLSLNTKVI